MTKYFLGKFVGFFMGVITAYTALFAAIGVMESVEKVDAATKNSRTKSAKDILNKSTNGMFS